MIKRYIIILFLLAGSLTANSQVLITLLLGDKLNSDGVEFGLEGGMNWSMIGNLETKTYYRTFNLGFYFHLRIKDPWWIYTGVLVKGNNGVYGLKENDAPLFGIDTFLTQGDYAAKISSFMVPVFIKYNFRNHMFIEAGPQFSLMYKLTTIYEHTEGNKELLLKDERKDLINKIDAGVGMGFGYRFLKGTGWTLEGRAYYGFVNVLKGVQGTNNTGFFLELKIPIGVGKKEEKPKNE